MGRKYQPLSKTVKETIDLVFELTTSNPDGYEMKAKELGSTGRLVVGILHSRGIIERVRMKNKVHSFLYKWAVASAPTKVLYGSVTQELSDLTRKKNERYNMKKKAADKVSEDVTAEEQIRDTADRAVPDLSNISDQDLWDELKRRGYSVDGKGLFVVKKTYLN